uniref:A kinase (PRKA) anchor protein 12a n=1 Tax=Cyprinus carpio TaxID=7962 RepID=A0A8C2GYI7_CYPCA
MGATASSAQRDSRGEEDAAAEELTAAASDARDEDDGSADDKLLQKNGQISSLNVKTRNHADELNGNFEERVLADAGSGFVTLKEDGTETIEDLQEMDAFQPVTKNESTEMVNADSVTVMEETMEDNQVNDINDMGFKKIFRFVGFKFTLKKDTCEKTEANEQEEKVTCASEDSSDTQENSAVEANEKTPDETQKSEVSSQTDSAGPSQQTENIKELDQDIKTVEHHVEDTPEKELAKEASPEPEEPMSPIKQFFTQGIFASLRKKKKEEEMQKESKEEELKRIEKMGVEEAEKEDSKCMCLDIPYITSQEEKDSQEKDNDELLPEGELQNSLEKDKVQGSPLKRLFRKFSTRRQRESKAAEKVIEAEERVSEQPKPSSELTELAKVEEPVVGQPKPAEEELVADVSPLESKKKSDITVSWEALICGGSAKKRARKTNEDETPDKGEVYEKTTDSPLGSSIEGDYDQLTSSNEQTGSPAEGEMGSTWKTFKKMVTPKRKVRAGESSTPEQIPSDSEMNKDESFSMKKLIPGHKKRKSDARKDQTSSDEGAKDHETGDEDDETPAIIPLSEYEIIEPESLKEVNEQRVEITIEHEMPEMTSQALEQDTSINLVPKIAVKVPTNTGPTIIHGLSDDFEELADFVSKHQQLSDIPEEGINEESIETPVSSAEWTTQGDTLAEDIVELTADAVTAPEPASEQFIGDDTTEMVSAVSQLTESPRSSGHVTPVSAEYGIQTSDVILQEAIQSICMTPSVQSVTTKDESQESLAVSFSPYIVHSSTTEETKVLVARKKTEATAICTGLVSQEIESVEEHLPVTLVEAIPEVSEAVPTELVYDNFTDETETAGLGTDEVYEAEIKEVKTEYQKVIINEKESATETELSAEQAIQLVAEPLVEESKETHIEDKKEEHTTSIECREVIEMMQSEDTHDPETECPLHPVLDEPVHEGQVAAEPEKQLMPLEVELAAAEFEQAAPTEVVASLTHGDVDNIPDTTTSKEVKAIEIIASAVECLETKETVSILSLISDSIQSETVDLEKSLKLEAVESVHVDVCETKVDVKDAGLLAGDSAMTVEDISEKTEENDYEKMAQLDIKEIQVEEKTGDAVASDVVENIEVEDISEAVDESLAREQLPAKEVSLPEPALVEELHKEDIDTNLDDEKVKEENAVKEGQHLTNTESKETENEDVSAHINTTDESPEIIVDAGSENEDVVHEIRECNVIPDFSKDVSEHTETPAKLEASSEIILQPLEMVLPEVKAKPLATEIVVSQTEDWSLDTKPSPEIPKENTQPATTENIKTGKVLEMVAIIENTTKQFGKEKPIESEPVTQVLEKSKLPKATEQKGEAIDGDQAPAMTSSEMKEIAVTEKKYTMAVAPKPESEGYDSEPIMIEVAAITVHAQNYTATEIEVSNMSEQNSEADKKAKLKCEPLEKVTEKKANELQVDKTEIKDEIPAVMEITPIAQVSPLTSEVTSEIPEVAVSEIQSQVENELQKIPVVTEVKVETAVGTELEVETPVATSVVTELEVETPEVTPMAKTTDTLNSAVASQNQNIDTDTSVLTTVIKEQMLEIPTVVSVVVTPATPLDETPVVTLGNESKDVPPVKDTPAVTEAVETPNVGSVIVRTAVAPVVEIQNVIPVVATQDLGSVIVTEAASPVISTATVTTVAEATVVSTVVEMPVFSVTAVKSTPAVVEKTAVSPVVEITATVTSVVQTPAVVSVAETVPPEEVTLDVTPFAETTVSQVIETPIVSITSVKPTVPAVTKTPVTEIPAMISVTVAEAVSPVEVTSAGTPVQPETIMIPEVETSVVISTVETSLVTPVVQTPAQISIIATDAGPPVTPPATAASETSAVIPAVETLVIKSSPVAVDEMPVVTPEVQTPGQVSVMVTETALPAVVSAETAAVETPVAIPVVETPVIKSTPVAVVETPVVTPVAQKLGQVSVMLTETAPPVVVSAVTATIETTPVVIPVVEMPVVKPTAVGVVETPVVTPVAQKLGQVSVMLTETAPPVVVSAVTATIETTPVVIPVVEMPVVKPTAVGVVETPVVTPVAQKLGQVSVMLTETAPPVVVSAVTATIETTPVVIPVVEMPVVKPTAVGVVETPVVTPVAQKLGQVSVMLTETAPPVVVSAVTATIETTPVVIPVVEMPVVKPTAVGVVETPVVTPVAQKLGQVSVMLTETAPPVVVSAVTATIETTPVVIPVVEMPVVKPTAVGVVETPVVTPVVQTPGQVSVMVTETAPPVVASAVTATEETAPVVIPVVETPVAKSTAVAVVETPVVTPGQVSVMVTETAPPVVVSAVTAAVETPVIITVVESPVVKPAPVAVVETPVMFPMVQTPGQVLVAVTEAAPPVVVSAVTAAAKTPVVIPVVETPTQFVVEETPVVTPVMMTPITERSVVSLVKETTAEAPAAISMEERPVMIPVVQTPSLVSVIAKEAAPPVILPAVTAGAETSVVSPTVKVNPPVAETLVPLPEVPSVIPAVQTPVAEQVVQTPTTPAVPLVKATSVVTGMEAPAVNTVVPVMMTRTITLVVAPPVVTPEVKKAMLSVVEQEKKEAKAEASVVSQNVEPPFVVAKEVKTSVLTEECVSDEENRKASLQHEPVVTSTEPQSEVEEDVWEDAVDNIGDSPCQVTYTEGAHQDTAAKQASDAAI